MENDELLTIPQAMDRLKVGRTRIYTLMNDGRLRGVKIGYSRRVFSRDLLAFMEGLQSPTDDVSPCMDSLRRCKNA